MLGGSQVRDLGLGDRSRKGNWASDFRASSFGSQDEEKKCIISRQPYGNLLKALWLNEMQSLSHVFSAR